MFDTHTCDNEHDKKESLVSNMRTVEKIMYDNLEYVRGLEAYIKEFEKEAEEFPEIAKEKGIKALIKMGVLNEDGTQKEYIVTNW